MFQVGIFTRGVKSDDSGANIIYESISETAREATNNARACVSFSGGLFHSRRAVKQNKGPARPCVTIH